MPTPKPSMDPKKRVKTPNLPSRKSSVEKETFVWLVVNISGCCVFSELGAVWNGPVTSARSGDLTEAMMLPKRIGP